MSVIKRKNSVKFIIVTMILIAVIGPYLAPYSPDNFSFDVLLKPSLYHLLGTDEMGHDIFSILLVSFRVTIGISIAASILSTLIGTFLAVIGAYYGGVIDDFIKKITDFFIIIPEIIILLFFATYSRPTLLNTVIAISFTSWTKVTKIIRPKAKLAIEKEKIKYTLLLKGRLTDVFKKLWKEIYPSVSTMFILQCSKAAVYEATLSYFGIGNPMIKSWGKMIKMALDYEGIFSDSTFIWYLLPPVVCICTLVASISMLTFDIYKES
ncbi:ABC transporter permease [Brassicibacter mesophilus]|uniref:ABC transporter permease n=1 Tax=Brassicibacter mesophilus TaxID=745119 RepID=UPI003D226B4A